MTWDDNTPVDETIEVTLERRGHSTPYVLVCHRQMPSNTVGYRLQINGVGIGHALENLQSRGRFPGKACPGWQAEVIAFANAGLYKVTATR